jgi:hypothetical protein
VAAIERGRFIASRAKTKKLTGRKGVFPRFRLRKGIAS